MKLLREELVVPTENQRLTVFILKNNNNKNKITTTKPCLSTLWYTKYPQLCYLCQIKTLVMEAGEPKLLKSKTQKADIQ